ncbi:YoaK family protein [Klenkia sp. LSe6-5]|uniref:YoaK family protein n=1 Tax=Klenkia sesuvii TaxID=3103137 RepID=A0ABU8DYB8_9ACTN
MRGDLRVRQALVVVLAAVSGATDAIGLLALGGAFTSVMTGNLVLLGAASATADGTLAVASGTAIVAFCLGVAAGTVLAGTPSAGDAVWPVRVTVALAVEGGLLAGYAAGWWMTGADRGTTATLLLLTTTAVALGVQSSTVQRFGVSGLSTTFLTGTLTSIVVRLSTRRPLREVLPSVHVIAGLVAGAAAGAGVMSALPNAAPALQLVMVGGVLLVALARFHRRRPRAAARQSSVDV